jgi:antibiotic biosynthesis monooxygenase (ABM) superfamily enzyme
MGAGLNLRADPAKKPTPVPFWTSGVAVRTIFLIILAIITARVASPQIETLRSVLETPSDLLRVGLGFTVCMWIVANIFILPKDAGAYRTWLYLGPAVLPLSLLCAFVSW